MQCSTPGIIFIRAPVILAERYLPVKLGGGHGGHNGLRDTITHCGADFWRLRLGIGHPGDRSQVIDYVLQRASAADEDGADLARQLSVLLESLLILFVGFFVLFGGGGYTIAALYIVY